MAPRRLFLSMLSGAIGLAFAAGATPVPARAQSGDTVIFAAASLKNALDDIGKAYTDKTGNRVHISFAGSSTLAKQIEQGAPADVYVSANIGWVDYLEGKGLLKTETRFNLLGNHLVLVAPKSSDVSVSIKPGFDLAGHLGDEHLAMANTDAVPAGRYGKASLKNLGVWDSVKGLIAQAQDVRAALLLVARGEAPFGIVYQTDAVAEPNVRVVARFPDTSHPPIIYPAVLTKDADSADAADFLAFLRTDTARDLFEAQGFSVLANAPSN